MPGHCHFRFQCRQHLGAFLTKAPKKTPSFPTAQVSCCTQTNSSEYAPRGLRKLPDFFTGKKICHVSPYEKYWSPTTSREKGPYEQNNRIKQVAQLSSLATLRSHSLFLCHAVNVNSTCFIQEQLGKGSELNKYPYCTRANGWKFHSLLYLLLALFSKFDPYLSQESHWKTADLQAL